MSLRKIQNGDGISMTLMMDEKPIVFNLVILNNKDMLWEDEKYHYTYGFLSEDRTLIFSGNPYSGGNTGFGYDPRLIHKVNSEEGRQYEVVAADLEEIYRIIEKEEVIIRMEKDLMMT